MKFRTLGLAAGFALAATLASASDDCAHVGTDDFFDLDADQVNAVYACLEEKMATGYAKGDNEVAAAFRGWTVTATRPAVEGSHGSRLLQTFANDIAAPVYMQYAEEGVVMPEGSVLAKESISLSKKKKTARPGPLFIMTKMETGSIPETDDWLYDAVQPNGKPMKIKQSFCHNCHVAYSDQDNLAYPVEDVRIKAE